MERPRLIAVSVLLLIASVPALAQIGISFGFGGVGGTVYSSGRKEVPPDTLTTFLASDVDVPPQYPGGNEAIAEHFMTDTLCNAGPIDPGCRKKMEVSVWVFVERNGSVSDARIDRGGCEELQTRTLCSVLNMKGWQPGTKNGHPVRTRLRLPVHYTEQ